MFIVRRLLNLQRGSDERTRFQLERSNSVSARPNRAGDVGGVESINMPLLSE
jgi:hypothetical protein